MLDRITPSVNQLVVHVDQVTHTRLPAGLDPARPLAASATAGTALAGAARPAGQRRPARGGPLTVSPRCWPPRPAPTIHTPHIDYLSILPMLIMMGGALVLMVVSSLFRKVLGVGTGTLVAVGRRRSPPWWPPSSSGTT